MLVAFVLELLEVLALHGRRALDLEEGDAVRLERFGNLRGEVGELNEDEDTLVLWDGFPTSGNDELAICDDSDGN